jgi:hypothetical protein
MRGVRGTGVEGLAGSGRAVFRKGGHHGLLWLPGAAGLLLIGTSFAPSAQADIRCSYAEPPKNLMTVRAAGPVPVVMRRGGDRIVVREFLNAPRRCSGGTPSVLNTDTIRVFLRGVPTVDLELSGGPFAPGATPEAEGASE